MTCDLYDEMHLFKYFLSFSTHLYLGVVEYFWADLGEKISCFDFAVNRFCVITYMKTCNWFGLWVSKLIEVHYFILDLVTTDSLVMSDTSKLCMPNNLWNILYRAVIPSSRVVMHGKVLYLLQSMPFYIVKWSLVIRVISSFPKNRSKMHISEIIFVSGGTENGIREILK